MQDFAHTADAVGATRSRLQKAALLEAYFARLDDADLARATRYLSGQPFPLNDQRVLGVGWAQVRDALLAVIPTPLDELYALSVKLADLGDMAGELLRRRPDPPPTLALPNVATLFDALAAARGSKARVQLLTETLSRATTDEARYLVKIIMSELRIGLNEGQVEDAVARAYGSSVADVQRANMLVGDIGETAVLARHGRLAEARMRLFHPLKFMLASPTESAADITRLLPGGFRVEDKFDGVRAQVHKQGDRLAIYSRTLDEVVHRYPELDAPLRALRGEFILDGEILGMRDGRAIPFTEFQPRLGRKTVDAGLLASLPVVFMAFDILYANGEVLLDLPLDERRAHLESLLANTDGPARLAVSAPFDPEPETLAERLAEAFAAARERGNEGLMVKDPASAYKPGRRGKDWLKIKQPLATLDVVVTGVEWGNGKRRAVLSDYTFAVLDDDGRFVEVGKAYTGLTDAEIAELTEWFQAHTLHDFGKFRRVEPRIVLEVAFNNVQASNRHPSGYALRFPRIVRVRDDKLPADIDTLATVRALAQREAP